jgi:hypothetical protein
LKYYIKITIVLLLYLLTVNAQQVEILQPNGGELIGTGERYKIQYRGPEFDVFIEYSPNNGWDWALANIVGWYSQGEIHTKLWDVPDTVFTEYLVKITSIIDSTNYDISDSIFSVYPLEFDNIAINEINMSFANNGKSSETTSGAINGFLWPGGENATQSAVFYDGFVFGGLVNEQQRIEGTIPLWNLMIPGNIPDNGEPANPADSLFKIWKIRKNWEQLPPGPFRDRLEYDYNNWPVEIGAPWLDKDGDGIYTPGTDDPKYYGDETNWFVCNTSKKNPEHLQGFSNLEVQYIYYGYENIPELRDVIFKKYIIINKGEETINDFIFGHWSDFDLGNPYDDFVGNDSVLSVGIGYNGDDFDEVYGIPPAIGYQVLQGPIVTTPNDSALFNDNWISGYKNLPMTSFAPIVKDWMGGISNPYDTEEWVNNLHGFKTNSGDSIADPIVGRKTVFALAGDPVAGIGWYEGDGWPQGFDPYDRRLMVNTGGFTLAPGDTQEVVFAVIMAQGTNRFESITKLRQSAKFIREFYYNTRFAGEEPPTIPEEFKLSQNYPNPFNPSTTIEYEIPRIALVELKVFDILGSEVETLVKEEKSPGTYKVIFEPKSLASGVYIYIMRYGDNLQSKKMLLIK